MKVCQAKILTRGHGAGVCVSTLGILIILGLGHLLSVRVLLDAMVAVGYGKWCQRFQKGSTQLLVTA